MNQKWIIKFEKGALEQTYKVSEMDVYTLEQVKEMMDESFLQRIQDRFTEMSSDWNTAISKI